MNLRRYKGRLSYDDESSYVDVDTLIVRESEIAFSLASVSQAHGRWLADSSRPATLQEDGSYYVTAVQAKQEGRLSVPPWDVSFTIESETPGESIELSGYIAEGQSYGTFYGELKAY
jgi:hypothetical protein